jgi:hypothetical protein
MEKAEHAPAASEVLMSVDASKIIVRNNFQIKVNKSNAIHFNIVIIHIMYIICISVIMQIICINTLFTIIRFFTIIRVRSMAFRNHNFRCHNRVSLHTIMASLVLVP